MVHATLATMRTEVPKEGSRDGWLTELRHCLAARTIPFVSAADCAGVEAAGYTIWAWATEAPYAVYEAADLLPRWQFQSLDGLVEFLEAGRQKAA